MTVHTGLLRLETEGEAQIVDLTEGVEAVVRQSGVSSGVVSVFVTGSTISPLIVISICTRDSLFSYRRLRIPACQGF